MTSRYGIFCLIFALAALGLGYKNYETWSQPAGAVIKREVPKKPETRPETTPAPAAAPEATPRESYKAISEKNIFHPDRQEFPVTGGEQAKPSARPQVALHGVILSGDFQSATIVNPGKPLAKGEREAKTVRVGDRIGDYKVVQIQEDRIVMESAGDSFEVLLYDPSAPKKRMEVKTPVQPVAVTSAAPGPAAAASPAPASPPRTPAGGALPSAQPSPAPGVAVPIPQPSPQTAAPRPMEPAPGTAMQPQATPSPTAPTSPFRGRGRYQPGTVVTSPQGN